MGRNAKSGTVRRAPRAGVCSLPTQAVRRKGCAGIPTTCCEIGRVVASSDVVLATAAAPAPVVGGDAYYNECGDGRVNTDEGCTARANAPGTANAESTGRRAPRGFRFAIPLRVISVSSPGDGPSMPPANASRPRPKPSAAWSVPSNARTSQPLPSTAQATATCWGTASRTA